MVLSCFEEWAFYRKHHFFAISEFRPTMGNNGHKWAKMGYNGQQWTTMDNNPLCYMHLWYRFYSKSSRYERLWHYDKIKFKLKAQHIEVWFILWSAPPNLNLPWADWEYRSPHGYITYYTPASPTLTTIWPYCSLGEYDASDDAPGHVMKFFSP